VDNINISISDEKIMIEPDVGAELIIELGSNGGLSISSQTKKL